MQSKINISVVILTNNEAINIARCIKSVEWSNDILILDSGSCDETIKIARSFGARIIKKYFTDFASQRNFAIKNGKLKNNWVLHLDADEVVSIELLKEMSSILTSKTPKKAYRIPFKLIFNNKWLKHAGMYPGYQVRFGKINLLKFKMQGHGQVEVLKINEIGTFKGHVTHYNFSKGISVWLAKHAFYAKNEALYAIKNSNNYKFYDFLFCRNKLERRRILKAISFNMPFRPLLRFFYILIINLGFLDGFNGIRYAMLMAYYEWAIDLNIKEHLSKKIKKIPCRTLLF